VLYLNCTQEGFKRSTCSIDNEGITVPSNCKPLSISIKDKHNRNIWGGEENPQPAHLNPICKPRSLNPNAFVSILLTRVLTRKPSETGWTGYLQQRDNSAEREPLSAKAAPIAGHARVHSSFRFSQHLTLLPGRKQTAAENSSKLWAKAQGHTFLIRSGRL